MTMQAIIFDHAGEPADVLRHADAAMPTPVDNQVLVKVVARPIHPADLAFIRGQYRVRPQFPQAAGLEGAGWSPKALQILHFLPEHGLPSGIPEAGRNMLRFR